MALLRRGLRHPGPVRRDLGAGAHAPAAPSPEYQIKAIFLFQFAQFVEWPARAFHGAHDPLVIGVCGEDPFGSFLDEAVRGEKIGERPLVVRRYRRGEDIADCHILFISRSESGQLDQILARLKGRSVLTVGDMEQFQPPRGNRALRHPRQQDPASDQRRGCQGLRVDDQLQAPAAGHDRDDAEGLAMAFRDTPIRSKLTIIIMATSGVVLLLTCAAFLAYEIFAFRQGSVRELSTLGQIVATNSTAALAFDNQSDATEILGALKAERHIVAAALYDRRGDVFAQYPAAAPPATVPTRPGADGYSFGRNRLSGFEPIVQIKGSERLGTLYLESDLEAMFERLRLYGLIALLVVTVSFLVAYALSRKLQRQISRPILALAETARAVSDRGDYAVRAQKQRGDELGLLTDAFNQMLGQIQEQNLALQRAYDDLRQTQQAIMQQERLRALGEMASGIAHDINNALSPASLYAESLLEREPDLSARSREYLTTIQQAIDNVAQTVSRLREFYRKHEPQLALAPFDLNQLAGQVAELTRARWGDMAQQRGAGIELKRELESGLPPILGVESEIRDALINLIFNAVDAMPEGGTITLRTRLASTSQVCIEVIDTGVGMDEETKRRCLEPFFTTKGERGTGLGLAMVYGTLRRHSGEIEIESTVGLGTTVRLLFPLSPAAMEPDGGSAAAPAPHSRLRLLVVDDDALLLKSLVETLQDDGHEVLAANGGQAGIDAFHAAKVAGRPFAAVFTDLGMPQVDGRRVAEAVKAASPATPVFLVTGWGQRMAGWGDTLSHVDRVLNKPPKLRELREAVASVPPAAA